MFRRNAPSQFSELKRLVSAVAKLCPRGNKDVDQHGSDGSLGATQKVDDHVQDCTVSRHIGNISKCSPP